GPGRESAPRTGRDQRWSLLPRGRFVEAGKRDRAALCELLAPSGNPPMEPAGVSGVPRPDHRRVAGAEGLESELIPAADTDERIRIWSLHFGCLGNQGGRAQPCLRLSLLKLLAQEFHRVGHHCDRSDHPSRPQDSSLPEVWGFSGTGAKEGSCDMCT